MGGRKKESPSEGQMQNAPLQAGKSSSCLQCVQNAEAMGLQLQKGKFGLE